MIALALVFLTGFIAVFSLEGTGLVVGLWGLVGAAAAVDLLITSGRRSVQIETEWPDSVFVGTKTNTTLQIQTRSLPRALQIVFGTPEGLNIQSEGLSPTETGAEGVIGIRCSKRDAYPIERIWLRWPSRLGLFDIIARYKTDVEINGVPNIQAVLSGEITANVNAELFGSKTMNLRGEGSDFHQLREFTAGMDTRMIDWKRSARHNTLVARETHVEQNHQIILCVDNGHLMREEIAGLPKIDHAINAALALTWAAGIGGDLAGFYSFDSRPQRFLPPQPGRQAFNRIRAQAAELEYSSVESNHTLAMAHLNGQLNRRSLIVVFSDFVDSITAELLVENIGVLSRHHLLIFVALRDPALEAMRTPEDMSLDNVARAVSAAQINQERALVFDTLRRLGVVCLDVEPGQLTAELVSTYLDIKAKELI